MIGCSRLHTLPGNIPKWRGINNRMQILMIVERRGSLEVLQIGPIARGGHRCWKLTPERGGREGQQPGIGPHCRREPNRPVSVLHGVVEPRLVLECCRPHHMEVLTVG
jgi:hypothetical protein